MLTLKWIYFFELGAEITDESFRLLDEETIHALIPKIGPRLIFKEKLKKYLKETSDELESQFDVSKYYNLPKCFLLMQFTLHIC